jgi:SpoIID/LytB domain protein
MNNFRIIFILCLGIFFQSCVSQSPAKIETSEPPRIILHPKPLGNGGMITRDLFRSFWILPAQDSESIRIGIIPSAKKIRLRTPHHFIIRVYGEHQSFDIASPGGVTWEFEFQSIVRPPVLRYLVTVGETSVQNPKTLPASILKKWIDAGFAQAQWVGPPKMDSWNDDEKLKRYFIVLSTEIDRSKAEIMCKQQVSRKLFKPCKVITRMDLPHLAKGIFRAQQSNFEKEFEGVIEIIPSKKDSIEVFDVKTSLLSENRETLQYTPSMFVVPNLENQLSLVQSTTLEEYLKSVVPSEIFPESPLEALKAQTVIARTYAFQSKDHYSDKPFLTCASTECQVYLGEKTKNKGKYVAKAVEQTRSLVLKEQSGFFAETFYHGSSGGKTDMKQLLLGGVPKPYLAGASDFLGDQNIDLKNNENASQFLHSNSPTYCSSSRFSKGTNWSYHFDNDEIKAMLSKLGMYPPLRTIEVLQRGFSGRAIVLKLTTATDHKLIHGELPIRSMFGGLPSSFIVFEPQMNGSNIRSLTILGRGSGHGVGLSQMGAIGRALDGQDYEQILQTYYPGTILTSIDQ